LLFVFLVLVLGAHSQVPPVRKLLDFAAQQLKSEISKLPSVTSYPLGTVLNKDKNFYSWGTTNAGAWTSGFFPGELWGLWEYSREFNEEDPFPWPAANWTVGLASQANDTSTHDVGFKVFYSFGHGYLRLKIPEWKQIVLQAAETLSKRFNPTVGCIRSWEGYHFPVIVDNMMNLELLFWASQNGGKQEWFDMAVSHADKTIENHIRPAGNTFHLVDYDPVSGKVLQVCNCPQGLDQENATWGRGQAWSLAGFALSFRYTGYERYLRTAIRAADWYLANVPSDLVPIWDFAAPPSQPRDTSAAAITASALVELSRYVKDGEKYLNAAYAILNSLSSPAYLADPATSDGILLHGTGTYPDSQVDVSLSYGDYYFIEALLRILLNSTYPL